MSDSFPAGKGSHPTDAGPLSEVGLAVDIDERGDALVATVRGVIDLLSTGPLQEQLNTALSHGATRLVLDLAEVTFVDSTGLGLLVSLQRRTRGAGGWLRLVNPRPQLGRMLHTTNLDQRLQVYTSVESALAA
jgi:anti-sigma B factor antagonist